MLRRHDQHFRRRRVGFTATRIALNGRMLEPVPCLLAEVALGVKECGHPCLARLELTFASPRDLSTRQALLLERTAFLSINYFISNPASFGYYAFRLNGWKRDSDVVCRPAYCGAVQRSEQNRLLYGARVSSRASRCQYTCQLCRIILVSAPRSTVHGPRQGEAIHPHWPAWWETSQIKLYLARNNSLASALDGRWRSTAPHHHLCEYQSPPTP